MNRIPAHVAALILLTVVTIHVSADEPNAAVAFRGAWSGKYENSQRQTGPAQYQFTEDRAGRLKGDVTWDGKRMELSGERLGNDAVRLRGSVGGMAYRYLGSYENGELVLHYTAQSESGESYFGVSRLKRQDK